MIHLNPNAPQTEDINESVSHRLLGPVSSGADVVETIMSDVPVVDRLPGHPHAEGGFFINPHVPHPVTRSWRIRESRNQTPVIGWSNIQSLEHKTATVPCISAADAFLFSSVWHLNYRYSAFQIFFFSPGIKSFPTKMDSALFFLSFKLCFLNQVLHINSPFQRKGEKNE